MSRSAASKMYADGIKITSAAPGLNDVGVDRGRAGRFMVNNVSLNIRDRFDLKLVSRIFKI